MLESAAFSFSRNFAELDMRKGDRIVSDLQRSHNVGKETFSNNCSDISLSSKIPLMRSLVTSIFLYACESWTLTAALHRRIQAVEMRCYHKILHISNKDHVTNEEARAKIQQAIGPHEDLLTIVKRLQTAVVWSCLPFIRSGQNHLARHSERG